jgi:hypothetical protein
MLFSFGFLFWLCFVTRWRGRHGCGACWARIQRPPSAVHRVNTLHGYNEQGQHSSLSTGSAVVFDLDFLILVPSLCCYDCYFRIPASVYPLESLQRLSWPDCQFSTNRAACSLCLCLVQIIIFQNLCVSVLSFELPSKNRVRPGESIFSSFLAAFLNLLLDSASSFVSKITMS